MHSGFSKAKDVQIYVNEINNSMYSVPVLVVDPVCRRSCIQYWWWTSDVDTEHKSTPVMADTSDCRKTLRLWSKLHSIAKFPVLVLHKA